MPARELRRWRPDFWTMVLLFTLLLIAVLLFLPVGKVFLLSFSDAQTGEFTFANYARIFSHQYYVKALNNTLIVGVAGMLGACVLGIPLAYCMSRYHIPGKSLVSTLAVLALVSPPFIGAYAWIMIFGANGVITNWFKLAGIQTPTIYGYTGIILVFSLKFYPFVYLMTESAFSSINKSLEEAAENLGCTPFQRFRKVTLPLVFPAVSTGAILSFVLSIADFGTPSIIGRKVRTLSTVAYSQYTSELGGPPTLAVTVSMLMIAISIAALLLQRYIISKKRYASSLTNLSTPVRLRGWKAGLVYTLCFSIVLVSVFPSLVVIYTSFLETSGPVFTGGFGLSSYNRVINEISRAVINSFLLASVAVVLIGLISGMISYIIVRREGKIGGVLDTILMVPYLVPGIVMAIGFVTTFNRWPVDLVATATIIILVVFIRRLPYGVRSTTASLRQIKPSIEEAAASLGARPLNVFMQVTTPLIMPGLIAGAMMSFITAINELSSTLILYTGKTVTMPVYIYISVLDGEFGIAAALSTLLLVSTGVCVYIVFRISHGSKSAFL
ncbi:MAG: iron ABC transporter permease [Granulosicoccus sp.]|nr:iron ABC transporter permease [Granulosicoccus sp.]